MKSSRRRRQLAKKAAVEVFKSQMITASTKVQKKRLIQKFILGV